MMRQMFTFLGLMALTCGLAAAADIDGKWTAETEGRNGPVTQALMLKADGNTLTGSMQGGRGGAVDISDGTIMAATCRSTSSVSSMATRSPSNIKAHCQAAN